MRKNFYERALDRLGRYLHRPYFATDNVSIGKGVTIGQNVRFNCKRVIIGDGVVIQDNVRVDCDEFSVGDFATIYSGCFFPGPGILNIGHNFWLGAHCIVDSQGGTKIGNNVGIGAHSQLWTHMKFGDIAAGCRFHSKKPLTIEDDVWLVGHTLVSPVKIAARSMVMLGAVVTTDIPPDRVYAGTPAVDVTGKFGPQFKKEPPTFLERKEFILGCLENAAKRLGIKDIASRVALVERYDDTLVSCEVVINIMERTYRKRGTKFERKIIRSLLPDAKFLPIF